MVKNSPGLTHQHHGVWPTSWKHIMWSASVGASLGVVPLVRITTSLAADGALLSYNYALFATFQIAVLGVFISTLAMGMQSWPTMASWNLDLRKSTLVTVAIGALVGACIGFAILQQDFATYRALSYFYDTQGLSQSYQCVPTGVLLGLLVASANRSWKSLAIGLLLGGLMGLTVGQRYDSYGTGTGATFADLVTGAGLGSVFMVPLTVMFKSANFVRFGALVGCGTAVLLTSELGSFSSEVAATTMVGTVIGALMGPSGYWLATRRNPASSTG